MPLSHPDSPPSHAQAWKGFLSARTPLPLSLSIGLAAAAALLLSPIFIPPFPVLLGRTLFVGLLGLLSFAAAGQWPRRLPRWMARWLLQRLGGYTGDGLGATQQFSELAVYLAVAAMLARA